MTFLRIMLVCTTALLCGCYGRVMHPMTTPTPETPVVVITKSGTNFNGDCLCEEGFRDRMRENIMLYGHGARMTIHASPDSPVAQAIDIMQDAGRWKLELFVEGGLDSISLGMPYSVLHNPPVDYVCAWITATGTCYIPPLPAEGLPPGKTIVFRATPDATSSAIYQQKSAWGEVSFWASSNDMEKLAGSNTAPWNAGSVSSFTDMK